MPEPSESDVSSSPDDRGPTAPQERPTAPQESKGGSAVLVGVDGADSRAAIVQAAREARYRDAPLIAMRAYSGEHTPAAQPVSASRTGDGQRAETESRLREIIREVLGDQADTVEVRAVLGLAGRKIIETAHRVNAQLIVLATHGSKSMLLGTVSQYVLRRAPCPVLIVPAVPARTQPAVA